LQKAAEIAGILHGTAEPYYFEVPGVGGKLVQVSCFLPHEVYWKLVDQNGADRYTIGQDRQDVATGIPLLVRRWIAHSDVTVVHEAKNVAAIGMHADAVQYTSSSRAGDQKSITVASFNFISARNLHDRGHRHLFMVLSKNKMCDCCAGYHSFQAMFSVFSWSMLQLMLGVAPNRRHDGSDFSDHDRRARMPPGTPLPPAALVQLRGDWDWYTSGFRLRSAGAETFCFKCGATKSGLLDYMNFSPAAPHRGTLISHEAYVAECVRLGQPMSTIFSSPGFTLAGVAIDAMHTADLGLFADIAGSILWLELTSKRYHRNNTSGLAAVNAMLDAYFKGAPEAKTPLTGLVMTQIRGQQPGFPFLKAKAAQVRSVVPFLATLANLHLHGNAHRPSFAFKANHRLAPRSVEHNQLVVRTTQAMLDFLAACRAEEFDANRCKLAMYTILSTTLTLHNLWRDGVAVEDQAHLPFHIRPKCHLLQHLVEDQLLDFGSPSSFHCYGDEDFVGSLKRVCHRTKHPHTLEARVVEKCRLLAAIDALYLERPELLETPDGLLRG
jgi:hypothetical protein